MRFEFKFLPISSSKGPFQSVGFFVKVVGAGYHLLPGFPEHQVWVCRGEGVGCSGEGLVPTGNYGPESFMHENAKRYGRVASLITFTSPSCPCLPENACYAVSAEEVLRRGCPYFRMEVIITCGVKVECPNSPIPYHFHVRTIPCKVTGGLRGFHVIKHKAERAPAFEGGVSCPASARFM